MFPSIITSFSYPTASSPLNSPSHSTLENLQSSTIGQIEAFIGRIDGANASAVGTLLYDVRAANSNGGGHVQTANKGGTGQTSYTKGDLLASSSGSVLAKVAVGNDNQVIIADSTQSVGLKWGSPVKISTNASVVTVIGNTTETSILSVTIPASVLSTNNVVRATAFVSAYTVGGASDTLLIKANYGNNAIGSILLSPSGASSASIAGKIEYTLLANANASAQRGEIIMDWTVDRLNPLQNSVLGIQAFKSGTSSVNSAANQTFGLTAKWGASIAGSRLDIDGFMVEKIT